MKSASECETQYDADIVEGPQTRPERPERRHVELKAYVVRADKKIIDVKVTDLSYDGCAITTDIALKPGEKVSLSVLGRGALNAVVRWYDSRKAGLLFQPDRGGRPYWPRKAQRVAIRAEASLRRSGRKSFRVAVSDITRFGCKCEFIERPSMYERVTIKFDGLETLPSVVCWLEESTLGLMFKNAIHPAVFEMLLAQLNPIAPAAPLAHSSSETV